jgi:hypothetical protein
MSTPVVDTPVEEKAEMVEAIEKVGEKRTREEEEKKELQDLMGVVGGFFGAGMQISMVMEEEFPKLSPQIQEKLNGHLQNELEQDAKKLIDDAMTGFCNFMETHSNKIKEILLLDETGKKFAEEITSATIVAGQIMKDKLPPQMLEQIQQLDEKIVAKKAKKEEEVN